MGGALRQEKLAVFSLGYYYYNYYYYYYYYYYYCRVKNYALCIES